MADLLFKRPICDEQSAPFAVHCPPWDPNKINKTGWGIADSLKFQEKKIVSPDKRKHIAEVSNFSVTSCLLKALKIE